MSTEALWALASWWIIAYVTYKRIMAPKNTKPTRMEIAMISTAMLVMLILNLGCKGTPTGPGLPTHQPEPPPSVEQEPCPTPMLPVVPTPEPRPPQPAPAPAPTPEPSPEPTPEPGQCTGPKPNCIAPDIIVCWKDKWYCEPGGE